MRKILYSLLGVFVLVLFPGCIGTQITGNPEKDADQMCLELVAAAESNDIKKADEIIDKYYEYYKSADLADRLAFIRTVHDNSAFGSSNAWNKFIICEEFKNSSANIKMEVLYKQTRQEAKDLGIR